MSDLRDTVAEMVEKPFTNKEGQSTTLQEALKTNAGLKDEKQRQYVVDQFVSATTQQLQNDPALASSPKKLAANVMEELAANEDLKNTLVAGVRTTSTKAYWAPESILVPRIKEELGKKMEAFFEKQQPALSAAAQENQRSMRAGIGFVDPALPAGLPQTMSQGVAKSNGV